MQKEAEVCSSSGIHVITEGAQISPSFNHSATTSQSSSQYGQDVHVKCMVRRQNGECVCVPSSKHIKQWGRVCILCKGRRTGRPGTLAAAHLGCNGNCLGSHLPNAVLSCCSLHCPNKANVSGSSGIMFVLGELRQTLKERAKFWPRIPLNWSSEWMPMYSRMCCPEEETAWGLELVRSQISTKTQHEYKRIRSHHGSD